MKNIYKKAGNNKKPNKNNLAPISSPHLQLSFGCFGQEMHVIKKLREALTYSRVEKVRIPCGFRADSSGGIWGISRDLPAAQVIRLCLTLLKNFLGSWLSWLSCLSSAEIRINGINGINGIPPKMARICDANHLPKPYVFCVFCGVHGFFLTENDSQSATFVSQNCSI